MDAVLTMARGGLQKVMVTARILWTERAAVWSWLKELAGKNRKKAERAVLGALLLALMLVITARVADQSREARASENAAAEAAAAAIVAEQEEREAARAMELAAAETASREEAEAVARVLAGVNAYGLSDTAKEAIIDVILNRADCPYGEFGDTVLEVCAKPGNWQGYVEGGAYLKADYELAVSVLSGNRAARIIPGNCYFLVVERGRVTVRSDWDAAKAGTMVTVS